MKKHYICNQTIMFQDMTKAKTETKANNHKQLWLYLCALALIFIIAFSYAFNSKIDLNGDNCDYYMLATSISTGHGYANIASPDYRPSDLFPPGYPLLMALIRFFTDSVIAQKILNGLFLLVSSLLLFLFVRKNKFPESLAFISCCAILLNARILHFATMMMSEMSYLMFSVFVVWALFKTEDKDKPFWKNAWFYLLIIASAYAYHIRTQGIALIAAVICYLIITKKWKQTIIYIMGFMVCLLPWIIRNKIIGLGQSRYLDQIFAVSQHRPEDGTLTIGGVIERFFDTLRMLLTKAIPNTVMPYINVDYSSSTTVGEWIIAAIIVALIIIGFLKFGKFGYFFILYTLATLGVISLFNDPGENRYITTLVPYLEIGLFIGLYSVIAVGVKKLKIAQQFSPWILCVLFVFCSFPKLKAEHNQNTAPFPPNFQNYFTIGEGIRKALPPKTMICSRKPNLLYMFSKTWVCNYKWTNDESELISDLVKRNVDYVILDQLGYSSTYRYLLPAIQNHQQLFTPVMHLTNPDTYLLKFDREAASKEFNIK